MFNDIRTFVKMTEQCSSSLSYPDINNYSSLKNKGADDDNKNPNYFTESHICTFSLTS